MEDAKHGMIVKSFIAISDTHLGLRVTRPLSFIGRDELMNTVTSIPEYFDQFLSWLIELERDGLDFLVDVCDKEGKICKKVLKPPEKLILNGDIFELYDAGDRAVELASYSVLTRLSEVRAEKIYLIGNHDIAYGELAQKIPYSVARKNTSRKNPDLNQQDSDHNDNLVGGKYPWGLSSLEIIGYTYPEQKTDKVDTLRIGEHSYLFLHGHQFNRSYGNLWRFPATVRDGSEAFRLYSSVMVGLWIITLIYAVPTLLSNLNFDHISFILLLITGITSVLAIPRVFTLIARPFWNRIKKSGSRRYVDHEEIQKTILDWWERFLNGRKPQRQIHVVYGHTHKIGILESKEKSLVMINHPAWVKDLKEGRDEIIQAVFLYADAEGYEFFGWDWGSRKPFHIPQKIVRFPRTEKGITSDEEKILLDLGWPVPLIEEWKKKRTHEANMS